MKNPQRRVFPFKGVDYKSKFEFTTAVELDTKRVKFTYETARFPYVIPAKKRKYTPDFFIKTKSGKIIIVETKGYLTKENRDKALLVREANPNVDIRFVFQSNNKIYKKSDNRYSDWCDKHKFQWALKSVPKEWIEE